MKEIDCINFALTRKCNYACPECVCNVPHAKSQWQADWNYMAEAAKYFRGVERIQLTGGEPTIHPMFCEWAPKLKELFGCKLFTVETNGYGLSRFPEIFLNFDWVLITRYTPDAWPGCQTDNRAVVDKFRSDYHGKIPRIEYINIKHIPRSTPSRGPRVCIRGIMGTAAYCEGLLYPCCIGWGVPGGTGIKPTENWREELKRTPFPCSNCWFGEP